jgi:hypothetical protein
MARKIQKFGKIINDNPQAMVLYEEQKALYAEIKTLQAEERDNVRTWAKMEGKYSIGTVSDSWGAGQGSRGYDYKYPSKEIKAKEQAERDAYYAEHIAPLTERISELQKRAWALEEPLCIAVWGFGQERYRIMHNLEEAEKELAHQIAYVEKLRKQLEELENGD